MGIQIQYIPPNNNVWNIISLQMYQFLSQIQYNAQKCIQINHQLKIKSQSLDKSILNQAILDNFSAMDPKITKNPRMKQLIAKLAQNVQSGQPISQFLASLIDNSLSVTRKLKHILKQRGPKNQKKHKKAKTNKINGQYKMGKVLNKKQEPRSREAGSDKIIEQDQ